MSASEMGRRGFLAACLGLAAGAGLARAAGPGPDRAALGWKRWHPDRPYRPEGDGPLLVGAAGGPLPAEQLHCLLLWASPPCVQQPRPGGGVLWKYSLRTAAEMTLVAAGYAHGHLAPAGPGQGREASFSATVLMEPRPREGPGRHEASMLAYLPGGRDSTLWAHYAFGCAIQGRWAELAVFPLPADRWHEAGHFRNGSGRFTASPVVIVPPRIVLLGGGGGGGSAAS